MQDSANPSGIYGYRPQIVCGYYSVLCLSGKLVVVHSKLTHLKENWLVLLILFHDVLYPSQRPVRYWFSCLCLSLWGTKRREAEEMQRRAQLDS